MIKISLCGAGGVGKTSLAKVFTGQGFNPRERLTVGVQHFFTKIYMGGEDRAVAIWDIGGEHRFRLLAPALIRGSQGVVYVFDITREETFLELDKWVEIVKLVLGNVPSVLIGNKADLQPMRTVFRDVAEKYAERNGMLAYFEVSAKNSFDVDKPFTTENNYFERVIFTSFTLKMLKVRCPQCGAEFTLDVTTALLNEASQSPMSLAGVALPHSDHVLVVYVDSSGGERGLRVFKSLQTPATRQMTEVLVPSDALKGLRNIGGFTIELGKLGLRLTSPAGRAALLLRGRKGDTSIELELVRNLDYQAARPWLEMLLEVIDTSYSIEVADYVNSLRALDLLLEERPFAYARQVLWLVANSSIVKTRLRMPEAQLVRTLKPSAIFERYGGGFVSRVLESGEARLRELLTAESPQLLLSSAEAVLALYRRGAIDLVVT